MTHPVVNAGTLSSTTASHARASEGTNGPLVTIAIPTFNRAPLLADCVRSALSQTYSNFEIVVSDNASTDETQAVLSSFHDPRLRVVRQPQNIGLMPNWNACLAEARGAFIVFVADDDRIAPWMLDRCVGLTMREPELQAVVALNDIELTEEKRKLPAISSRTLDSGIHAGSEILIEYLQGGISAQLCSIMMRTGALRLIGGFASDWAYGGDTAAWGQLLMSGRAGLLNEPCATFAVHGDSASSISSIDARLASDRRLVRAIDDAADRCVQDPRKCFEIKRQVRRYVARDVIGVISLYRRSGASLPNALRMIWQCRRELAHLGSETAAGSIRPIAIILLPVTVTRWIGVIKQKLRSRARIGSPESVGGANG